MIVTITSRGSRLSLGYLCFFGLPEETVIVTRAPARCEPGPGDVEITLSFGTLFEVRFDTLPTPQLSARRMLLATNSHEQASCRAFAKADDGSRTRDLRLGKPTLYQLSYVRVVGDSKRPASTTLPNSGPNV